jgi:hypothetical protein
LVTERAVRRRIYCGGLHRELGTELPQVLEQSDHIFEQNDEGGHVVGQKHTGKQ